LLGEYIGAYVRMIHRAPIRPAERRECYRYLAEWAATRAKPHSPVTFDAPAAERQPVIDLRTLVPTARRSSETPVRQHLTTTKGLEIK
jgi:hypothetical protein